MISSYALPNWFFFFCNAGNTRNTLTSSSTCSEHAVCSETWLSVLKKCCTRCLWRYLSVPGCHSSHSPCRRVGNAANHVLANVMWGEDVETTADVSSKPSLSPHGGQAFPGQLLCSALWRSKAGQEMCCGRGFSHGSEMNSLPWGIHLQQGRAPWKQRTGSTVSSPSTDISQRKHTGKGGQ